MLDPLVQFSSQGIGKALVDALTALYEILFPANAEAAAPVDVAK